ncbi:hypothetical protein COB47_1672 [Caldicellulosiruptor obsidiansis OB47]|uniref:Uncharacterized protein n=1 Tax=Caldicellulosiruptor obsidiansis (strain ATCC BAA-2073 / JCM 16842 / OB47) TaxID=608506 RepID=D9TFI2_CALOO|nr:hypothetical protein COB47_1672 [Caldicellulosiruptor obsidiansis OB47]
MMRVKTKIGKRWLELTCESWQAPELRFYRL